MTSVYTVMFPSMSSSHTQGLSYIFSNITSFTVELLSTSAFLYQNKVLRRMVFNKDTDIEFPFHLIDSFGILIICLIISVSSII